MKHPQVDMISFTGSTRAGKRISEVGAQTVKRIALELGGKSPSVILEDADLAAAVKGTVNGCLLPIDPRNISPGEGDKTMLGEQEICPKYQFFQSF